MTTLDHAHPQTAPLTATAGGSSAEAHHLVAVQLHVARRADELSRRGPRPSSEADRRAWLRAEFEVFEQLERRGARGAVAD
jgi:hypothetical protein